MLLGASHTYGEEHLAAQSDFKLSVAADWSHMGHVFQSASSFLESLALGADAVFRCAMVACELVENGIKYGDFSGERNAVKLGVRIAGARVTVQVTNPVGERSRAHLAELDRMIQWVRGFQDPFEAYLDRMRAISREPVDAHKSGLGILRIAYEGRAALDFFLDEDSTLSVSAVTTID